jgi:hypothetical protein
MKKLAKVLDYAIVLLLAFIIFLAATSCSSERVLTGKQQVKKDQSARMFKGW